MACADTFSWTGFGMYVTRRRYRRDVMSLRSYMSNVLLSPQLHHEVSGSGDVAEEEAPKQSKR
jgi:hypothetical protein